MWIYYALILFLSVLVADQGSKIWIVDHVNPLSVHSFIPGFFSITNVKNSGAAWSMLPGNRGLFILIGVVALVISLYYLWKCRHDFWYETAIALFMAGAFGNLISRFVNGTVTDMIQTDFMNFPIFNLADTALTLGVVILMILIVTDHSPEDK